MGDSSKKPKPKIPMTPEEQILFEESVEKAKAIFCDCHPKIEPPEE